MANSKHKMEAQDVSIDDLDIGSLAYFVGLSFNQQVAEALCERGFAEVRTSWGFIIQHLIGGARTITELARLMGVTQQAASKSVRAVIEAGLAGEQINPADARARVISLTEEGWAIVKSARQRRREIERRMLVGLSEEQVRAAREVLRHCLRQLGAEEAIRTRTLRAE